MKNLLLYFLVFTCISFASCSDDDDDSCSGRTDEISISVEGETMSGITGTADIHSDGERMSVSIDGTSDNNASVFFSCPTAVGTYDLSFDLSSGEESQTVTAFVPATALNVILSTGCIQVVSVDETTAVMRFNVEREDTSISGEIDLTLQ